MEQGKRNTSSRKGKHLTHSERILIEAFLKAGAGPSRIARELDRNRRSIAREITRGRVEHLNSDLTTSMLYNADRAQDVHDLNATAKGAPVKLKAGSAPTTSSRSVGRRRWSRPAWRPRGCRMPFAPKASTTILTRDGFRVWRTKRSGKNAPWEPEPSERCSRALQPITEPSSWMRNPWRNRRSARRCERRCSMPIRIRRGSGGATKTGTALFAGSLPKSGLERKTPRRKGFRR
ncbi:MAG: hypothetical protein DRP64_04025 [Verrucomicrobia bacterium]|nr:MAG: hypothetical protein DRP64_04025 [Verrucomicrobiota bacterium]